MVKKFIYNLKNKHRVNKWLFIKCGKKIKTTKKFKKTEQKTLMMMIQ